VNNAQKEKSEDALELRPDAWDRFERAVDVVTKSGPQHRPPKPPDKPVKGADSRKPKPAK
jgi:hypothetical protein